MLKCEFSSLGEVLWRVVLWWLFLIVLSSSNQNSDHAVVDSNLNTSQCYLFLFTFSCIGLTALFSHTLQSRGASAWETNVSYSCHYFRPAALRCCVEILRCSIRLYTSFHYASFHYASLSPYVCDQIRETISFGNIFELWYVYMEEIISVFLLTNAILAFFLYILRAFTILSLVLSFIIFLDTIF